MRDWIARWIVTSKRPHQVPDRGHRGGVISMHRALAHFRLGPMNLLTSLSLFVAFTVVWLVLLPGICHFWTRFLAWCIDRLPVRGTLEVAVHHFRYLTLEIPYLRIYAILPSLLTWSLTCAATLLLFGVTFFVSKELVPVIYMARSVLLIQTTALVYFALWPVSFPHTPDSYMEGLMTANMGLISVVPLLFALTYYIFDFGLRKKAFLTAITMAHLIIFLPFQVLLQALVLQKTVLFMPLLYIIFGMPLEVLFIIAFYSWGMTWAFRTP